MVSKIIIKQSVPSQYLFAGGYASFDSGTISGWHYYIQDYMGSNRMVVNGQTGATEQVTHYYPYGGVIGDISTNEGLQAYKFEGKVLAAIEKIDNLRREDEPLGEGKDRTFGLDWYDIHARQYDAIGVPGWNKPDQLAEKYYGISPYVMCAGNPVNMGDYNGKNTVVMMPSHNFHIAMLIQNNNGKYQYYSINGKDYYGIGHCEHDNLGEKSFSSVEEFKNSVYNSCNYTDIEVANDTKNGYYYTTFYELSTTEDQDFDIANKFKEISENQPYNLVPGTNMDKKLHREGAVNCATTVNECLKAGRVSTGVSSKEIHGFTPALLMESIKNSNTTGVQYGEQTIIQKTKDYANDKVNELKLQIKKLLE